MIGLEIAMLLIGLGAVAYSFRLSEKKNGEEVEIEENPVPVPVPVENQVSTKEWEEKMEKLKTDAEEVYQDIDDKLSRLSNEKIMGMNEYSDQVLDKIEKNHGEVVFLYDMMNEKQEELKSLVNQIDKMKADMKNEAEKEHQKLSEQEEALERIRKQIEMENLEIQAAIKEEKERREKIEEEQKEAERKEAERRERMKRPAKWDVERKPKKTFSERKAERELEEAKKKEEEAKRKEQELQKQQENEKKDEEDEKSLQDIIQDVFFSEEIAETPSASNVIDAEIARIEEAEAREQKNEVRSSEAYTPLAEQEKPVNHNNEIVSLYKKGHSIIEISKMLSLGQGEVKFVIDLYKMR